MRNYSSKRIVWVDYCKGVAIWLVILGHCPITHNLQRLIYSFHMPLFFILSGFFITNHTDKTFSSVAKRRIHQIIIPYIVFGLLFTLTHNYCFRIADNGINSVQFKNYLYDAFGLIMGFRADRHFIGELWFLPTLFCGGLFVWYIWKHYHKVRWVFISILTLIGVLYSQAGLKSLPFSMDVALIAVFFLALGAELYDNISKIRIWLILVILIIGLASAIANTLPAMAFNVYGSPLLFLLSGSLLSICFIRVTQALSKGAFAKYVSQVGGVSLMIYILHYPLITIARSIYDDYISINGLVSDIICAIVASIILISLFPIAIFLTQRFPKITGNQVQRNTVLSHKISSTD